jgi:hypothetical protein
MLKCCGSLDSSDISTFFLLDSDDFPSQIRTIYLEASPLTEHTLLPFYHVKFLGTNTRLYGNRLHQNTNYFLG